MQRRRVMRRRERKEKTRRAVFWYGKMVAACSNIENIISRISVFTSTIGKENMGIGHQNVPGYHESKKKPSNQSSSSRLVSSHQHHSPSTHPPHYPLNLQPLPKISTAPRVYRPPLLAESEDRTPRARSFANPITRSASFLAVFI